MSAWARRYLRLLGVQVRRSVQTGAQYRADFVVQALVALLWLSITLLPLVAVAGAMRRVAGWSVDEMLVVLGWFTLLRAVLEGAVSPSLTAVVEHVRTGTLDFILLKPADTQFMVSTAQFQIFRALDLVAGVLLIAAAFLRLGRWPSPGGVAVAALLLVVALLVLYSIWILVVSASFWVVRVDNLSYLLGSLFDAGRWPVDVFRRPLGGVLRIFFTFVFPVGLMTSYPAMALLGRLDARTALVALAGGLAFAALARRVWKRALGSYTSASS